MGVTERPRFAEPYRRNAGATQARRADVQEDLMRLETAVDQGDTVSIRRAADRLADKARACGLKDAVRHAHGVKWGASICSMARTLEHLEKLKRCFQQSEQAIR